jgi:GntR family transcriptional regulator, transcriptional repressor for pyruvate dehydrogenase complex
MSATFATSPRVLDRSRIGNQVFEDLKREIISGGLSHGAKLPTVRELSELYGVSSPTVREALRGLSVTGLVEVRHGSGTYVCANGESLMAISLGAIIQLETVGVADALEILSVLNVHAANRAIRLATASDLRRLREAADALNEPQSAEGAARGVRAFHHALLKAAHHPLLEAICGFLSNLQVSFATTVAEGSVDTWRSILDPLQPVRLRFVDALERRDAKNAPLLAREFHAEAARQVTSLPKAQAIGISDPAMGALLSSVVESMARGGSAINTSRFDPQNKGLFVTAPPVS